MLSLRGLAFAYPGQPVFGGWSAEIGPGLTWVVGDDGSGKTTLLKLIAGELSGTGTIAIDGIAPGEPGQVAWCDARDEAHDALPIAAFIDRVRERTPTFDASVWARHLDGFGLRAHASKSMFQLSSGTRRKVGLAATFAMAARVTLLDDPAAALDPPSVGHLMRTLADADRDPARVCLVGTHAVPDGMAAPRSLRLPPRG